MLRFNLRTQPPEVQWIWGKSDIHQSVYDTYGYENVYVKDNTKWWDGYEQQRCILIENFNGKWDLVHLLDRYPYQVEIRRGYVQINSPVIIIACKFHRVINMNK